MADETLGTPLPKSPALPSRLYGFDSTNWRPILISEDGSLNIGGSCLIRTFNLSATGTNTITSVSTGIKVYKAYLNMEADLTGHVTLELGSNEIGRIRNPIVGGNHVICNAMPRYEEITATGTLKLVLPTATAMTAATLTLHYNL